MTDYRVTGGCLCGGVQFEITKPPSQVHCCYCSMCRKSIGADFATIGYVTQEHFKMIKDGTLMVHNSSEDLARFFCRGCGCSLYIKAREEGQWAALKYFAVFMGTLDGDPKAPLELHMFVKDKAPWVKITDDLPQCDNFELLNLEPPKE